MTMTQDQIELQREYVHEHYQHEWMETVRGLGLCRLRVMPSGEIYRYHPGSESWIEYANSSPSSRELARLSSGQNGHVPEQLELEELGVNLKLLLGLLSPDEGDDDE